MWFLLRCEVKLMLALKWSCGHCYDLFSSFLLRTVTDNQLPVGLACMTCTGVSSRTGCMTTDSSSRSTMTCSAPLWRPSLRHTYDLRPATILWHHDLLVGYKETVLRGMSSECSWFADLYNRIIILPLTSTISLRLKGSTPLARALHI